MLPVSRKVMGSLDTSTINLAVLLGDVLQVCEIRPDGNMQLSLDTARAVAKLYDEAYASSRRLFGDDHPETRDNKWRAEGMREMFQEQGISLEPEAPHPDEADNDDAPPPLLDAGSSIRLLKAECARRGLSTEGCAEKGDLLRLLGIPFG